MLPKRLCTLALVGVSLSIILGVTAVLGFLSASADEPVGTGSDAVLVEAMQVSQPVPAVHKLPRVAIGAIPPSGVHLVSPREDVVQRQLRDQGVIPADATSDQVREDGGGQLVSGLCQEIQCLGLLASSGIGATTGSGSGRSWGECAGNSAGDRHGPPKSGQRA